MFQSLIMDKSVSRFKPAASVIVFLSQNRVYFPEYNIQGFLDMR
jgi:hypothetical protein